MAQVFYVYILECSDKTFYTGYTTDLKRRIEEHNNSTKGSKFTYSRRPVKLKYFEKFNSKSSAMKREWEIKQLSRDEKLNLVRSFNFEDLSLVLASSPLR